MVVDGGGGGAFGVLVLRRGEEGSGGHGEEGGGDEGTEEEEQAAMDTEEGGGAQAGSSTGRPRQRRRRKTTYQRIITRKKRGHLSVDMKVYILRWILDHYKKHPEGSKTRMGKKKIADYFRTTGPTIKAILDNKDSILDKASVLSKYKGYSLMMDPREGEREGYGREEEEEQQQQYEGPG